MKRLLSSLLAVGFLLSLATRAEAAPVTVSARVVKSCRITTANITLPDYDPLNPAPISQSATQNIRCNRDVAWTWNVDGGVAASATREMRNAGDATPLVYGLTGLAAGQGATPVAADPATAYNGDTSTGPSVDMPLVLTASVAAGQNVNPAASLDTYSDTVQVTITVVP